MRISIFTLVVLSALTTITFTGSYGLSQTQISVTGIGNSEIDLAWDSKDRIIRTWTEFSNFNPNDGSFIMQIIQKETGKVVSESIINVMSSSQNSAINFNSFVLYMVNAQDICQNKEFDANKSTWQECKPLTGEYELQVSTNGGAVRESTTFTIVDSRD